MNLDKELELSLIKTLNERMKKIEEFQIKLAEDNLKLQAQILELAKFIAILLRPEDPRKLNIES